MTAAARTSSPGVSHPSSGEFGTPGTYDDDADPRRVTRRRFDWLEQRVGQLEREIFLLSRDQVQIEATMRELKVIVRELRERVS